LRHDAAGRAFKGPGGEVFGDAKAAGQHHGVEVGGVEIGEGLNVAAGDAGGFGQHIARFGHLAAVAVVDDVVLCHVRREALVVEAVALEVQQGEHAFVNFGAIVDATTGEQNGGFHSRLPCAGDSGGGVGVDVAVTAGLVGARRAVRSSSCASC